MMRKSEATGLNAIQNLYKGAAVHYGNDIAPVIGPLARNLIDSIPAANIGGCALDVGTGTGLAAQRLVERGTRQVFGIDISPSMLCRSLCTSPVMRPVLADVCQPPFMRAAFDLIVASFGLALTSPRRSVSQVWKLLKPGGWFYFQEWAAQDILSHGFDEVFAAHTASQLPDQSIDSLPTEWHDRLQDSDDYRECLTNSGFTEVQTVECVPMRLPVSIEAFVRYKLAWPTYLTKWQTLVPTARAVLGSALQTYLANFSEPDNTLIWQPPLFRACARRPLRKNE